MIAEPGTAEPGTVSEPAHPVDQLTTYELRDYRRRLENAIRGVSADDSVHAGLRRRLDAVTAEQEDRARAAQTAIDA